MKTTKLRNQIRKILKEEISQTQDAAIIDYLVGELIESPEPKDGDVPLSEYFGLEEEGRGAPTKQYKLTGRIKDIGAFLKLVNQKIISGSIKTLFGRGSKQGRKPIPFSEEEIKSILYIIQSKKTFTATDFLGVDKKGNQRVDDAGKQIGIKRFTRVQQPNAILKALSDEIIDKDEEKGKPIYGKNYIKSTMNDPKPDPKEEPPKEK